VKIFGKPLEKLRYISGKLGRDSGKYTVYTHDWGNYEKGRGEEREEKG
jgi:hypothetical protein